MSELKEVIQKEYLTLNMLLSALERQHKLVVEKDVFGLEALVDEINECNKNVAAIEIERRKVTKNKSMEVIVRESNDEEIDTIFRNIKKILEAIKLQKETNELLIKQRMSYNNQILRVINPNRDVKTYNSYGNLRK